MADNDPNLIDVIMSDHREVEMVFAELENRTGSSEHRRQLADHVIVELVRHSVAEEMFMYPAARKALPDGDEIADHEIAEHAEADEDMQQLEGVEATDPMFNHLVDKLIHDVRHHIGSRGHGCSPFTACLNSGIGRRPCDPGSGGGLRRRDRR